MTRFTDKENKRTLDIEMKMWNGSGYDPDWSQDFFTTSTIPYDEALGAYVVEDLDYLLNSALEWEKGLDDATYENRAEFPNGAPGEEIENRVVLYELKNTMQNPAFKIERDGEAVILRGYKGTDSNVSIPDGVTEIGRGAFYECSSLHSVTIPDSVIKIGNGAFMDCHSLRNVKISDSVTEIGEQAFNRCSSLQSINIPHGVTAIKDHTFNGCRSLRSIIIPDSVTKIGIGAFSGCSSLQSITIPDKVSVIKYRAFDGCSSLKKAILENPETMIERCTFPEGTELWEPARPAEQKTAAQLSTDQTAQTAPKHRHVHL